MNKVDKDFIEALNAFLAIGEIMSFDGFFDEHKHTLENAHKTLDEIAKRKGLTVLELGEKVIAIVNKVNKKTD